MLKVVNVKLQLWTEEMASIVRASSSAYGLGIGLTASQPNMFHVLKC